MAGVAAVRLWFVCDAVKKAFSLGVVSLGFPIVLDQSLRRDQGLAETIVATTLLFANVVVALLSPVIGRVADRQGIARLCLYLAFVAGSATLGMSHAIQREPHAAAVFFGVGFIAVQLSVTLYDSLLVQLAARGERNQLSFAAWAWGFVGSLTVLAIAGLRGSIDRITLTILASVMAFSLIGIAIAIQRQPVSVAFGSPLPGEPWPPNVKWLMLTTFATYSGIDTVAAFVPLFMTRDVRISARELLLLLLMMQLVAIPMTLLAGRLVARVGPAKVVEASLLVWVGICVLLSQIRSFMGAVLVFTITGVVLGVSKAALRGAMAEVAPAFRGAELFGWATSSIRVAAIAGPAAFATTMYFTGSMRFAFLSQITLFGCALFGARKLYSSGSL